MTETSLTVTDIHSLAGDFAKSNYFLDARDISQAVVKIQAGKELGFGPVYSMTKIYIVKGKVMVSAEALGAMVKRSGRYDYAVKLLTDTECSLEFTDGSRVAYTSKFTMQDAERAKLIAQDSGWLKWPRAMLMSKALSQGARIVCPHVIAGVYTPADFAVETDEAGDPVKVVDVTPITEEIPVENVVSGITPEGQRLLDGPDMVTEAQRRKMFAVLKKNGYTESQLKDFIFKKYIKAHTTDLTKTEANEIIVTIEKAEMCS